MGNHEIKYVKYARQLREGIAKQDKEVLISQAKQEIFQKLSEANIQWLACRPYHFQMDNLIIVHGGICPRRHKKLDDLGKKKYTERLYRLRWIGENGIMVPGLNYYDPSKHRPWADTYDGRFGVAVYGHNTFQTVRVSPYAFGIDTGCCFGGQLTALVQESSKPISFESVQARAVYYPRIELEE
jgi:diadenosine tetraphosphatase ApaH/serine/threonine PP2A family protein phosphatase